MACKSLPMIARKFSAIPYYLLGSSRISRSSDQSSYNSIVAGLTLWYGVILDYNAMFCLADEGLANRGRILKHATDGWSSGGELLTEFLATLDELGDLLIASISSSHDFKGRALLMELNAWSVPSWMVPLRGAILKILRDCVSATEGRDEVRLVRVVRQISCFLKKLDVSRPDLEKQMFADFFYFEDELQTAVEQRASSIGYLSDIFEMKTLLDKHLDEFCVDPFVPGHGPGAVADSKIKSWYEKHAMACSDRRVGYLLAHAGLGIQQDYLPLVSEVESSRTSRYICVPKTWKKLRGISAEPPELQFWQQGILRRIDAMFRHDKWWRKRVNLHDQYRSRDLALEGSITGEYSTVDLSAASDSVTLQLVRDLFGNSHLGRWLLGTRSTHTLCNGRTVRISKFAPMGSACCFPVECMVFVLAAEVAVSRTRTPLAKAKEVCVFGDDIILPSYATQELFEILSHLGFSVNTEKSFWTGNFREACGVEAWHGHDISPCRFRSWRSGVFGRGSDYDEVASLTALANQLYERGLHDTREFLLGFLLHRRIPLGGHGTASVDDAIFASFSGENSTLASPLPTNFHLERKFSHSLQTHVFRRIVWQERPSTRRLSSTLVELYGVCEYTTWLVRHQPGWLDYDKLWSNGMLDSVGVNPYSRLPVGTTMVPTLKWVTPPTFDFL